MTEYNNQTNFSQDDNRGQQLIKKAQSAFDCVERRNVETLWQELAEFILPSQNAKFNGDTTKATKKDRRLFDNTGPTACRDLAAALHSTITNPAAKWSKLRFRETELNNDSEANGWTSNATTEIHNSLSDSNFDNQIGRAYQSYCGFATMVLLQDELYENGIFKGFNFNAWHLSEVAYSENYLGIVDCIYRKFKLTLRQAYGQFGDAIGDLKDRVDFAPDEEHEFIHCIYTRDKKDLEQPNQFGQNSPLNRPVASIYIMKKGNKIVKEDGYYEFPVFVARWLTLPGEIYGYGPGHIARADVLTLNSLIRQILKGLAKAVDPVIFQEQNNILSGDMRPGRIVPVRNINGIKEGVTQSRFDIGFMEAKELRDSIKSSFYIDKLMLPPRTETGEQTAYEIQQRLEQMQVVLGPPMSRLNTELLQPLIMRTLNSLIRNGRIPPIPQSIVQKSKNPSAKVLGMDVAFVNSLARSQQMAEIRNITSWVQESFSLAQMGKPESLDRVNADEIVEKIARIRDIPEELVLSDEEVAALRQQRQQQVQSQQAMQAGMAMGDMAKNMGQAQGGNVG